jgi:hypothetical protein
MMKKKKKKGFGAVCYAAPLTARNLQWISTVSTALVSTLKSQTLCIYIYACSQYNLCMYV